MRFFIFIFFIFAIVDRHLCNQCNKESTTFHWCQPCNSFRFQQEFDDWTSGNDNIDAFIKGLQTTATHKHRILEWIPYQSFRNVKFVEKGDFGDVYSAEWADGKISYWSAKKNQWKRNGFTNVTLKCIDYSQNITNKFLNEIRNFIYCCGESSYVTRIIGITRHEETKNFIIVMQYMAYGNFRNNLSRFYEMSWTDKLNNLYRIAKGLRQVHKAGLIIGDFHTGNILLTERNLVYITDFGLCRPISEYTKDEGEEQKVYGVLPYIAPEVLCGKEYTEAADVYAFGVIMSELLSGIPPFHNVSHDNDLAIKICNGIRPEIPINIPKSVAYLIQRCWDAEPQNRFNVDELCEILDAWQNYASYRNSTLAKQIRETRHISSNFLIPNVTRMQPFVYTCKHINFKNLPDPKNSTENIKDFKLEHQQNV